MPVSTLGHIVVLAHNPVGPPRHQVRDPGFDPQVAAGTGVDLEGPGSADGLHDVAVSTLGFGPTKARRQALEIEGLWLLALTFTGPIAAGHTGSQYQFFC